ncbi:MAG: FHA domain-containing protein [Deltaproteobacteria bacterium]|nr:FHA domain-containing protein [Deltaproteobacteria bacterium]
MEVPILVVTLGSKTVEKRKLDQEMISIGRVQENDIVINNLSVSRYHAIIYNKGGKVVIKDMGSSNGTFVNGAKVDEADLWIGDVVLIGKHVIKFSKEEDQRPGDDLAFQREGGTVMVDARTQEKFLEKLKSDPFKVPRLILSSGREIEINSDYFTVGKGENSNLKIDGLFIKNPHAKIIKLPDDTYRIISMGSFLRPSTVNGSKVKEKVLRDGDIIKIGGNEMMFVMTKR